MDSPGQRQPKLRHGTTHPHRAMGTTTRVGHGRLSFFLLVILAHGCGSTSTAPTPPPAGGITSLVVGGWLSPLTVGQSVQLGATAFRADGSTRSVTTEAAWQTSDATVAIVSPVGLVTALHSGRADIRASYEGQAGSLGLSVAGPNPAAGHMGGQACGGGRRG